MKIAHCAYPEHLYAKVGNGVLVSARVAEHDGRRFLVVFQAFGDRWHHAIAIYRVEANPEGSVLEPVTGTEFSKLAQLAEQEAKKNDFGELVD